MDQLGVCYMGQARVHDSLQRREVVDISEIYLGG